MSEQEATPPLGVSVVVRLKRAVDPYPVGTVGLIVDQLPARRHRYKVMIPGDPYSVHLRGEDLEALQGVDPNGWWRR